MNHRLRLTSLVACALATLAASPVLAITTAPSWLPRETVASGIGSINRHFGQDRILAYDHHGNPGIAFFDAVGNDLRYARRVPGVGWVHSIVHDTGGSLMVGQYPSLAFDRYERPAISYSNGTGGTLQYARFDGTSWILESADDNIVGPYSSLAFDNLGRAAISYLDALNSSLKYIRDTDGDGSLLDETPITVVNDFNEGLYSSLVFDPLNRPMIAHFDTTNDDLRFSLEEPGIGWVTTTVDSAGNTGDFPSIGVDPDTGFPAIAYFDNNLFELRYAEWNGSSWDLTTVDSAGSTGLYPSLVFDPADGNPAIAYHNESSQVLKLAWHDGVSWQTQTVDAVGNVGWAPSLAFNDFGSGFPSIAYLEEAGSSTDNIYFIEDPLPVPEPATVWLLACGAALVASARRRDRTAKAAARKKT